MKYRGSPEQNLQSMYQRVCNPLRPEQPRKLSGLGAQGTALCSELLADQFLSNPCHPCDLSRRRRIRG